MSKDEISELYKYWITNLNKEKRLTKRRSKAIEEALKILSLEDLKLIIKYVFNSQDDYASFIRGDNDLGREYTDILNLLRIKKLEDKLEKANSWNKKGQLPEDDFGWSIE